MTEKQFERDCQIFGEDVIYEFYKYLAILECDELDEAEEPYFLQNWAEKVQGTGGLWAWIRSKLPKFGKAEEVVQGVPAAIEGAGETIAKTGILEKVFGLLKGGISTVFSPANLPKVLATAGGAALIALLIRALKKRKKNITKINNIYEEIKYESDVLYINEILGEEQESFKYLRY